MKTINELMEIILVSLMLFIWGCASKDQDGKVVETIKIGNKVWMAKNLNVEHYRNGDPIPQVQGYEEWNKLKTGAWCYYNKDPINEKQYGKLYNWYAVNDPRGLSPKGWHIPTEEEFMKLKVEIIKNFNTLRVFVHGVEDLSSTNKHDFYVLLGGIRISGQCMYFTINAYFWSSTETKESVYSQGSKYGAMRMSLIDGDYFINLKWDSKENGLSIRCLKD